MSTDTGHYVHYRDGEALSCNCGWRATAVSHEVQVIQAVRHHREVCEKIVRDQVWWRKLWRKLRK